VKRPHRRLSTPRYSSTRTRLAAWDVATGHLHIDERWMSAACSTRCRKPTALMQPGNVSPCIGTPSHCSSESNPAATRTGPLLSPMESRTEAPREETERKARSFSILLSIVADF
jgi:hypothetical protein